MRVRKKPWAEAELENNPHVVKSPAEWKGKWAAYFGNENPIALEIGCGKGRFITQNAVKYPEYNFIGMERQLSVAAVAARLVPEGQKNMAILCANAEALAEYFAVGEIHRIYINFCDPWPKKKWAKRRLTHHNFLESYQELFHGEGEVFFKTDNCPLFEFSLNEFLNGNWKVRNVSLNLHDSGYEENIMTEYEEKFSRLGNPIYRLEATWKE